jgi:ORF6N domain
MNTTITAIPDERIITRIYTIRGKKIMLERDLAELYGVLPRRLNEQVKRNPKRFPEDFMFQLTKEETAALRSQNAILKGRGHHAKYLPHAFTQEGVAMLPGVLTSDRAIAVNVQIMRTFTKLRELLATHVEFRKKIEDLEQKYDRHFKVVFDAINRLLAEEEKPKRSIGFGRDTETSPS